MCLNTYSFNSKFDSIILCIIYIHMFTFMLEDIGWIFLYIVGFDMSDLLVKKYIKSNNMFIVYYSLLTIIGVILIVYNK
jgi:hypothetical protein